MIDTHAHVNFHSFKNDLEEVFNRAKEKGITIINVGSQYTTSHRAVELAQTHSGVYAAVGLHPIQMEEMEVTEEKSTFQTRAEIFDPHAYRVLARDPKVVAIGECGLDYYHLSLVKDIPTAKENQKAELQAQINLANEVGKPLIIHGRGTKDDPSDAYRDLLRELKKNLPKQRGVLHSYSGDQELAEQFVELGFYFGFNGILTFDKTGKLPRLCLTLPAERIVAETDCPYLTPEPFRGKRNEPMYVEYVISKIAEIRGISFDAANELTSRNAKALFNLA